MKTRQMVGNWILRVLSNTTASFPMPGITREGAGTASIAVIDEEGMKLAKPTKNKELDWGNVFWDGRCSTNAVIATKEEQWSG